MGKFYELILAQSPKSTDSFELIDPVNNLSLENVVQPTKTDQSTNLQQINEVKRPRPSRFHPYERQKRPNYKKIERKAEDECDMDFLKSFGYIEYSAKKESKRKDEIESLSVEINRSIQQIFSVTTIRSISFSISRKYLSLEIFESNENQQVKSIDLCKTFSLIDKYSRCVLFLVFVVSVLPGIKIGK